MDTRVLVSATILLIAVGVVGPAAGVATPSTAGTDGGARAAQAACSYPIEATDATGTEVALDSAPERIVALQPSDAQLLWAVGTQDRVVGMGQTEYTAYLSGREGKTNVKNDDLSVNVEQVVGLQPDLVLASNTTRIETVRALREAGITVYHFGLVTSLDEIATNLETTGRLVGNCEAARAEAAEFRLTVERARTAGEAADERPSVLYYFFGTTAGPGTHIHDVVESAGGNNVAADAGIEGYAQLNSEVVVDRDPEWIVHPDDATIPKTAAYNGTTAVQEGQTVALPYNYISQPGPRVAVPLTQLAKTWHQAELDAANESVTATPTASGPGTETSAASAPGTGTPAASGATTTSATGPGFGAAATLGVLALVGLGAVASRRSRRDGRKGP